MPVQGQMEETECDSLAKKLKVDAATAAEFSSDDGAAELLQELADRQYGLIAQAWHAEVFVESVRNEKGNSMRPLTPFRLIEDMADRLGDISGRSVLTFNIEFVPLLVERGAKVTLMTRERCKAAENFVSSPTLGIQSSYLEMTMEEAMSSEGLKFDIVIGNPPYQPEAAGDRGLWAKFIQIGNNILVPGGTLAMIVPHGWKSPTADIRKGSIRVLHDILAKQETSYLNLDPNLGKKYFSGVGQTFTWFITRNAEHKGETEIDIGDRTLWADISGMKMMPREITKESLSIVKKMTSFSKEETWRFKHIIMKSWEWDDAVFEKSKSHSFERINGNSNRLDYPVFTRNECAFHSKRKVFLPRTGSKSIFVIDSGMRGVTDGYIFLLDDGQCAKSAETYFNSRLIQWIGSNKYTQYNEGAIMNSVGMMPLDNGLKESDIAAYYGITADEMKWIDRVLGIGKNVVNVKTKKAA